MEIHLSVVIELLIVLLLFKLAISGLCARSDRRISAEEGRKKAEKVRLKQLEQLEAYVEELGLLDVLAAMARQHG